MKKNLLVLFSSLALSGVMILSTSCSKDDDPTPGGGVNVTSVTSVNITLNNQSGASGSQKYVISSKSFASNDNFDIAYGNGTGANNKYFIGGPTSESIYGPFGVYGASGGSNETEFYNVSGLTTAKFDTLVNKAAISSIVASASGTGAESNGKNYRIKSETPWAVGTTFAIKTDDGTWALAKVTSAPTGNNTTAGTVGLALKF